MPAFPDSASSAAPLAVYVHWPFCQHKCPYCDFNSHVRDEIDTSSYGRALAVELTRNQANLGSRRVDSIFFGGGTPSLMPAAEVARVIDCVAGLWKVSPDIEITLEANPSSAEAGRFSEYRDAGVNRLSLGVQALDDDDLSRLGRFHDVKSALTAVDAAQAIFPRTSFDIIYAREDQSLADWEVELGQILELAGEHLSLYQLTVEEGTPLHYRARQGRLSLPDDETAAQMFELTAKMTRAAGLPSYEISNHARSGGEARHNLHVWQGGDYLGVGPGAHGRYIPADDIAPVETRQYMKPEVWLRAVQAGGGDEIRVPMEARARCEELILQGLRLSDGINRQTFKKVARCDLLDILDPSALDDLIAQGFIEMDEQSVRVRPAGRLVLNGVIGALVGDP